MVVDGGSISFIGVRKIPVVQIRSLSTVTCYRWTGKDLMVGVRGT
jgi:hypothetical protein